MPPSKTTAWRQLRRVARALKHTPDRLLHGARRRRSQAQLVDPPGQILFVCHGNICRSPYAAAAFEQRMPGSGMRIVSAGFMGPGRSVPENGVRIAQRRGLDLTQHRSQLLTAELVRASDLIVVMDESQRRGVLQRFQRDEGVLVLGDLDPLPIDTRTVRDPYNQSEDVFDTVYDRIDRCLGTLAATLTRDVI